MSPYWMLGIELLKVVAEWIRNRESRQWISGAAKTERRVRLDAAGGWKRRRAGKLPKGAMLGALVGMLAMLGAGCAWLGSIDWGSLPPVPVPPAVTNDVPPVVDVVMPWHKQTKTSAWIPPNAAGRNQNIFSPHMSDAKFRERVKWMKDRGCNYVPVFVANEGDGEYAGYCIYGTKWDWTVDKAFVKLFLDRRDYIIAQGMAYQPWLGADDSSRFNAAAATDFGRYLRDLWAAGLLDKAAIACAGLELNEYYTLPGLMTAADLRTLQVRSGKVKDLVAAMRAVYSGKIMTHETSQSLRFAALADVVAYQVSPGKSADWLVAEARRVCAQVKKPVCMFEIERGPDRAKCEALFKANIEWFYSVGNW